jgi:hypothetical protein
MIFYSDWINPSEGQKSCFAMKIVVFSAEGQMQVSWNCDMITMPTAASAIALWFYPCDADGTVTEK